MLYHSGLESRRFCGGDTKFCEPRQLFCGLAQDSLGKEENGVAVADEIG
jgi:hypothetical protein